MRIAWISDTHRASPDIESKSLFPRRFGAMDPEEAQRLYNRIRLEIDRAYFSVLEEIKRRSPFGLIVHMGDVTGGHQEQGCCEPLTQQLADETKNGLLNICPRLRLVVGDHDTGYSRGKRGLLQGGISEESIEFLTTHFGPPFWKEDADGMRLFGICSPLLEYSGSNERIVRLRREQEDFIGDELSSHKEEWMLCIHNPWTLKFLEKQIRGHTHRMAKMVCGHLHDPQKAKLIRRLMRFSWPFVGATVRECFTKSVLCPSTAPLWWQGYRFLISEGTDFKEISVSRPMGSQDVPMSSFWKCLFWMMGKRAR